MNQLQVLTTDAPGSPTWKLAHKGRIGGHGAASILGVGYQSPLQLWAELTGKLEPEDISRKPWIRRGIALEPVVSALYAEETGRTVLPSPGLVQHPTLDWVAVTPDGLLKGMDGVPEFKTFGLHMRKDWSAKVPDRHYAQGQLYCVVLGVAFVSFGAMAIDDDEEAEPLLWKDEPSNQVFQDYMMGELVQFREKHWLTDIPPPATAKDLGALKRMFPKPAEGKVVELSSALSELWRQREEMNREKNVLEKEAEKIQATILQEIQDAEYAVGEGFVLRCKVEPRSGYQVEPSRPRILRKVKAVGS